MVRLLLEFKRKFEEVRARSTSVPRGFGPLSYFRAADVRAAQKSLGIANCGIPPWEQKFHETMPRGVEYVQRMPGAVEI